MKTQAFLLTKTGSADKAFQLTEIETPNLQEDEILIEVEAFGLNYADIMIRYSLHSDKPKLPAVIGYEAVGTVIQVGTKANPKIIGKRVVAIVQLGAYAKHIIAKSANIVSIGEIDANTALALALQGVTAYYMSCYFAPIKKGENVLIHAGAGGVGTLLLQLAKQAGAKVIAKVSSEQKRQICLNLGADLAINYKKQDYVNEVENLIGKNKLDVSFNPIGGATFKQDLKLLNVGSKMILFGASELKSGKLGVLSKLNFALKMGLIMPIMQTVNAKSFIGVNMLKILETKPLVIGECLKQIVGLYQQGTIKPIIGGNFKFNELSKAHQLLESGNSTGKIAIFW